MNIYKRQNKRVSIFIDGGNFYFKLKSLDFKNLSTFGYSDLLKWLARDRQIIYQGYYVGVVRAKNNNEKGQRLRLAQRKLFNHLINQNIKIKKGYLMKNDGVYHEKGVDVQLAVDMLVGAYEDKYDTAIIISSDTDLIPAMGKVKELGKGVEYIGFAHQPTIALQTFATISRLLIKEELDPFAGEDLNIK